MENNEFLIINSKMFAMDDSEGNKKFIINLRDSDFNNSISSAPDFFYIKNSVYFRLKSGNLVSIENPGINSEENINKAIVISYDLPEYSYSDNNFNTELKMLEFYEQDILVQDGEIKTIKFDVFDKFWNYKNQGNFQNDSNDFIENIVDLDGVSPIYIKYIGRDLDGNYYWDYRGKIIINNNKGMMIEYFKYDYLNINTFPPAVHPSGDVYFLHYDSEAVYLNKIARVW